MIFRQRNLVPFIYLVLLLIVELAVKRSGNTQLFTRICIGGFVIYAIALPLWNLIYDRYIKDRVNPSALYAGNKALKCGFSPRAQNGQIWNPKKLRISQIFKLFPARRSAMPKEGTAGFVFYTNRKRNFSNHMDFYDFRYGGDVVCIYNYIIFGTASEDHLARQDIPLSQLGDFLCFVPLEPLETSRA